MCVHVSTATVTLLASSNRKDDEWVAFSPCGELVLSSTHLLLVLSNSKHILLEPACHTHPVVANAEQQAVADNQIDLCAVLR